MIDFVIDASALVELATARVPDPDLHRRVRTASGAAPELIGVEALHAVRAQLRGGRLDDSQARRAAERLIDAPLARMTHRPLLNRIWQLRDVLTAYDAAYVALAENLDVPLLTCDARLGRAHGHAAEVIVYPRS